MEQEAWEESSWGAGNKGCLVCREFKNNNGTKNKSICSYLQQFSTTSVIKHTNLVDWTLTTNPTHERWYTTALIPSFSCVCVWFFVTPWTIACQAPPSMGSPGKNTRVGCHSLLQGIFPTQGSNPDFLHCRQILYCLSHQGGLYILPFYLWSWLSTPDTLSLHWVPWMMAELDERLYLGGREMDGLKVCVCLFSPWRCLGKRSGEACHGVQLWFFPWRQMLSPNLESGSCWERECPGDPALMSQLLWHVLCAPRQLVTSFSCSHSTKYTRFVGVLGTQEHS